MGGCMTSVRCVAQVGAVLGESPLWDESRGCLWWLDIKAQDQASRLLRLDPAGLLTRTQLPGRFTALAPTRGAQLIACSEKGFGFLDPDEARWTPWLAPAGEPPGNRCNDAKVDRHGRLWAGTMDDAEQAASGALHRLDPDGQLLRIGAGFRVPNGPAFDGAGRMYVADSPRRRIYRYPADALDSSQRTLFAAFSEDQGCPDGMTCDAADHLWVAFWDGGCIRRLSPAGEIAEEIRLPVARPTACAFGGARHDTLYVTSASIGLSAAARAQQPLAGGLFALVPATPGLAPCAFGASGPPRPAP